MEKSKDSNIDDTSTSQTTTPRKSFRDTFLPKRCSHTSPSLFLSSETDAEAMDIIYRHFKEFSTCSLKLGYSLSIQYDKKHNMTAYLTPLTSSEDSFKVTWALQALITKHKLAGNSSLDQDDFSSFKEQINLKLASIAATQTIHTSLLKSMEKSIESSDDLLVRLVEEKIYPKNGPILPVEKNLIATEVVQNGFYEYDNIEELEISDEILEKMCERLSKREELDIAGSPLEFVSSMEDKKKILTEFLEVLQGFASEEKLKYDIRGSIASWFTKNWTRNVYYPTDDDKMTATMELNEKFGFVDDIYDVVGTVHLMPFHWDKCGPSFLSLAICDQKIVCWSAGDDQDVALTNLHNKLEEVHWQDGKFFCDYQVEGELPASMKLCDHQGVYKQNKQVVSWLRKNFECLNYVITTDCSNTLPALYNMTKCL